MTSEYMEWLNQNRHRAYPMVRDEWRRKVMPTDPYDCILLDALAFDSDASEVKDLTLDKIEVSRSATKVHVSYGGNQIKLVLTEGDVSGEGSYERIKCVFPGAARNVMASFALSSHAYIKELLPDGTYEFGCHILPTRVVSLSDGYGVDRITANGSTGVDGHAVAAAADGEVVLEDGYRTSPIISHGRVLVRVGKRYGLDPCHFDFGVAGAKDCRKPLFFFCGQNAINSGNLILKGGKGVSVKSGGKYDVITGHCAGKTLPCIEIIAGRELLDMYRPSEASESSGSQEMV